MENKFKNLPLRSGVGIVVLNEENKIFLAKRIDNPSNFWQMPSPYSQIDLFHPHTLCLFFLELHQKGQFSYGKTLFRKNE